jgi:hypothetical protein
MFTVMVTVAVEDLEVVTVSDDEYVPTDKSDGKLTVTLPFRVPLVGETLNQLSAGATDHLIKRFPSLRMFTVWEDGVVPSVA